MYKVSFYPPSGKKSPREFMDKASQVIRAKITRQVQHLEDFGLTHANPDLKKISNTPLWELRILGKDNIRIICMSLPKQEVVVLHIFAKKTQKTPQKELSLALRRYKEVLDN